MLVRTSIVAAALAIMATPIFAQQTAPRGAQELAEQQKQQRDEVRQVQPQAQPQRQPQQIDRNAQQGQVKSNTGEIDVAQVAEMLILGNQAEVELGNFAMDKTQNAEVRDFAEMMVKDHTAFIAKLKKFTGDQADARGSTTGAQAQSSKQDAMADLHRKAGQLELTMTKQMLGQYEGQDFDMGYLGHQCVAHTKMLACLTAAKDVGPQEFQTTIEEGIKTTREHLQHAKQISMKIKNKEYGEGQRREAARPDLREGDEPIRDGGARPSIRPDDSKAPREGVPQRTPQSGVRSGVEGRTDTAPQAKP